MLVKFNTSGKIIAREMKTKFNVGQGSSMFHLSLQVSHALYPSKYKFLKVSCQSKRAEYSFLKQERRICLTHTDSL